MDIDIRHFLSPDNLYNVVVVVMEIKYSIVSRNLLPVVKAGNYPSSSSQCDQIGRFNGLWATF